MTKKIALKPKQLAAGGIFLALVLTPRILGYLQSRIQAEVAAAQETATLASDTAPTTMPSQIGAGRISQAVLTRATFLLNRGRESGDVETFITERYKAVNDELWELGQQVGVFDGQAEAFARLANLSAEQQAVELVQFWLQNPDQVHSASGMAIQVQPAGTTQQPEVNYADVQP
ncbi:MAG TPA: hypothetical protein V6D06_14820 [Trichocoleus sp.]